MLLPACASVSPAEPQICGATAHCWDLRDCLLQAQLPSPAPLILNSFGVQNAPGRGGVTLSCPAPQKPRGGESASTHSTLLFQPAPIPALHLSQKTSRRADCWEVSLNPKKPARGRILLKARGETTPRSHPHGEPTPRSHPRSAVPRTPGPPASAQTRQRSLGDVTQETDMTVK